MHMLPQTSSAKLSPHKGAQLCSSRLLVSALLAALHVRAKAVIAFRILTSDCWMMTTWIGVRCKTYSNVRP